MNTVEARRRFADARVAVLATADAAGAPHVVPVTFVVDGGTVYSAVDDKPKRVRALRRHDNIRANPRVSLLVQQWDEDWSRLWWVRADGTAALIDDAVAVDHVTRLLRRKYHQYGTLALHPPVIAVTVRKWRAWP